MRNEKNVKETPEERFLDRLLRYEEKSTLKAACYFAGMKIYTWCKLARRELKEKRYMSAAYCFSFCVFAPIAFLTYAGIYIWAER